MPTPSHDPTYPLYPILSIFGFVLSLIPFGWHLHAWNIGTCAYMIWTGLACLCGFVNSLVWSGNVVNRAPVWCDISAKLIIGAAVGIPASIACISRRLYGICSVKTVSLTREQKRYMIITDMCIAVGVPVIVIVLHCVVQDHRYDILEEVGCYPVVNNTLPTYFVYYMWPVLLGIASFVYSAMTLHTFWTRRAVFSHLISNASCMNISRYLRLVVLVILHTTCPFSFGIYTIYEAANGPGPVPWISWSASHRDFLRVGVFDSVLWRDHGGWEISVEFTRWLPVASAFLFFALFGFASEARSQYCSVFWKLVGAVIFKGPKAPDAVLPSWIKPLKLNPESTFLPPPYSHTSTPHTSFNGSNTSIETRITEQGHGQSRPRSALPRRLRIDSSFFERPDRNYSTPDVLSSISSSPYPSTLSLTIIESETSTAASTPIHPRPKPSHDGSLRTLISGNGSDDRIYLSNHSRQHSRTPSPLPFAHVMSTPTPVPVYLHSRQHSSMEKVGLRPDSSSPSLPLPILAPPFVEGIFVTVHTVSDAD